MLRWISQQSSLSPILIFHLGIWQVKKVIEFCISIFPIFTTVATRLRWTMLHCACNCSQSVKKTYLKWYILGTFKALIYSVRDRICRVGPVFRKTTHISSNSWAIELIILKKFYKAFIYVDLKYLSQHTCICPSIFILSQQLLKKKVHYFGSPYLQDQCFSAPNIFVDVG